MSDFYFKLALENIPYCPWLQPTEGKDVVVGFSHIYHIYFNYK